VKMVPNVKVKCKKKDIQTRKKYLKELLQINLHVKIIFYNVHVKMIFYMKC
jgi:hypothetical protein